MDQDFAGADDAARAGGPARTTLLRNGAIYSPGDPFATAMLVEGESVVWIGSDAAAAAHGDDVDETIDLDGALVTPAFVDAHVHATSSGLALTGVDLSGCRSKTDLLDRVAAWCAHAPAEATVLGHGWDESSWPGGVDTTGAPAGAPVLPTRAELDRAAAGRRVYLTRVDVHSALVSGALAGTAADLPGLAGYQADGPLSQAAHHAVRELAHSGVTPAQRAEAQRAFLARAASLGIGAVHECGGPTISSEEDFTGLLALARSESAAAPYVFGYWGELADPEKSRQLGAVGAGGDLFIDGALGSHTACLREPYLDASPDPAAASGADGTGQAYLEVGELAAFLVACVEAGVQPGFHVIGDGALDILCDGLELAHDVVGERRLRAVAVRAEHAEMLDQRHIKLFARHGVVVSAQPGFDAAWGGPDGMYAQRLGVERAAGLNPFAELSAAGVVLAFGSDSPVIAMGPWAAVRAAVFHRTPSSGLSARAAFAAHTRGGWRALPPSAAGVPADETGVLAPGSPATYAIWSTGDLVVQAPDSRVAAWSTDERAAVPGLPNLSPGRELPICLRTAVRGRVVFDAVE
ncbi:MAG TPA: amidohydrolase family protein [Actinocrinis sp.]|nr:amidohydrolase family protein [Actinocrinis sp.]